MSIKDLKKSYNKVSELALKHQIASNDFNRLVEEHYGIPWFRLESIVDHDPIIDTIDYGTDALSFEEFDKLVISAIKNRSSD